jgi:hypothetical protein
VALGNGTNDGFFEKVKASPVWKSVFRHGYADTPRNRILQVSSNVFLHLHPSKLPRHAVRVRFTWCAGGVTFLFYLILVVTGVILMFYYRPTAELAYQDMKYLQFDVPFGMIMRNMHRWSAHAMVIAVWIHMLRVFMTGSYKPPREFNWIVGVNLLVFTLLLSFTGAVGPAVHLGRHGRDQYGTRDAFPGPRGTVRRAPRDELALRREVVPGRRAPGRRADAAALLRAALHLHPDRRERAHDRPLLAHPEGRRHQRAVMRVRSPVYEDTWLK